MPAQEQLHEAEIEQGVRLETLWFSLRSAILQRIFFRLDRNQLLIHGGVHASLAAPALARGYMGWFFVQRLCFWMSCSMRFSVLLRRQRPRTILETTGQLGTERQLSNPSRVRSRA